jgi:SPP1 gp7 family putative phage head morphogenesis protein
VTKKRVLQTVRQELSRQIKRGFDPRTFAKFALARLEKAGWTPRSKSHLETVMRTNVMRAYNAGRAVHQRNPIIAKARPLLMVVGVLDDNTRSTHRAVQGWHVLTKDPVWSQVYPPFGFNCRDRCVSKSLRGQTVRNGSDLLAYVPDPGFRGGLRGLLSVPG